MNSSLPVTRFSLLLIVTALLCLPFIPSVAQGETPKGWKTFEGAYFDIGVPPGFTAKPITTDGAVNGAYLTNQETGVEFQVFSPQWDGDAPFKKAGAKEKIDSSEIKESGKEITEEISLSATDGSYTRFVLSQTFVDEANATHTNKTFGIKVPDMKTYGTIKALYVEWKKTLVQFAD